jgi:hypothetical protein
MMEVEDLCRNLRQGANRAEAAGQSRIAEALRAVADSLTQESSRLKAAPEDAGRSRLLLLEAI